MATLLNRLASELVETSAILKRRMQVAFQASRNSNCRGDTLMLPIRAV
jgi:hypothetical protein